VPAELKPLVEYFERTYIGTHVVSPMFPIKFWNVHERTLDNSPRTSNFVGGFHNKLNKLIKTHRPPFCKFLMIVRRIQHQTEISLTKLNAPGGLPRLQQKKYREANLKLTNFLKSYRQTFKVNAFTTWIYKVTAFVPEYQTL